MASEVDGDETVSEVMAQLAEAEAAEAEALADAARAKATAARLRGSPETPDTEDVIETVADEFADVDEPARRWWSRLSWPKVGLTAVAVAICAILALTGLMLWQHHQVNAQRAHKAEFVTAASEGVLALLSIDYNHAKADVQKVIDHSTGSFRDDFTKGETIS